MALLSGIEIELRRAMTAEAPKSSPADTAWTVQRYRWGWPVHQRVQLSRTGSVLSLLCDAFILSWITNSADQPPVSKSSRSAFSSWCSHQPHVSQGYFLLLVFELYQIAMLLFMQMGPSGSGKTTFLDVLAGRKSSGTIDGTISYGGLPPTRSLLKRATGEQNEILHTSFLFLRSY